MNPDSHHALAASPWVERFAPLVPPGGDVLDVAAGAGRHSRLFLGRGHRVVAVDREPGGLRQVEGLQVVVADLEHAAWPFSGVRFSGVVVTNYLWRPLFPQLASSLAAGGVLIYETFAQGNERHGRPRNPEFLLRRGELLGAFGRDLTVVAFEQGEVSEPEPAVIQRICAVRGEFPTPLPR